MKVAVLGASGMLGSMVLSVLGEDQNLRLLATIRPGTAGPSSTGIATEALDATSASRAELVRIIDGCAWVVNCIGLIKHHIQDDRRATTGQAIRINALFPHLLAEAAQETGSQILQIATDCVYSGAKGPYREADPQDALDVYGKSKSLGEVVAPGMHHLRCSIIGPELKERRSLLEWFLGQPVGTSLQGYSNHLWNGVTTLHFARICRGILRENTALPQLCHVVPGDLLSKGELLLNIRRSYGREDLQVELQPALKAVDRTLATSDPALNLRLWRGAGYEAPLTLAAMVEELAQTTLSRRRCQA